MPWSCVQVASISVAVRHLGPPISGALHHEARLGGSHEGRTFNSGKPGHLPANGVAGTANDASKVDALGLVGSEITVFWRFLRWNLFRLR